MKENETEGIKKKFNGPKGKERNQEKKIRRWDTEKLGGVGRIKNK